MSETAEWAAEVFNDALRTEGLPKRTWYTAGETARILGLSVTSIKNMCAAWEPEGTPGRDRGGLESYKTPGPGGHWRINRIAIIDWLRSNHTYERAGE